MTSHELARKLLEQPDIPVSIPLHNTKSDYETVERMFIAGGRKPGDSQDIKKDILVLKGAS
jgi:hypothetical protein